MSVIINPLLHFFSTITGFFNSGVSSVLNFFKILQYGLSPISSELLASFDFLPMFVVPFIHLTILILIIKVLLDLL